MVPRNRKEFSRALSSPHCQHNDKSGAKPRHPLENRFNPLRKAAATPANIRISASRIGRDDHFRSGALAGEIPELTDLVHDATASSNLRVIFSTAALLTTMGLDNPCLAQLGS